MDSSWEYGVFCDRRDFDPKPEGPEVVLLATGPSPQAASILSMGCCPMPEQHQHKVKKRQIMVSEWSQAGKHEERIHV